MDPIVIGLIAFLALFLILRIFFGIAKMVLRVVVIVVLALLVWRVMHPH